MRNEIDQLRRSRAFEKDTLLAIQKTNRKKLAVDPVRGSPSPGTEFEFMYL